MTGAVADEEQRWKLHVNQGLISVSLKETLVLFNS